MAERLSIDDYYVEISQTVAKRSTCLRNRVGAVIVRDNHILTTGYNGAPRGLSHCLDIGCLREEQKIPSGTMHEKCRAVHAEQNAIIQAALHGIPTSGATLYCTHQPCILCTKMIINAGIKRVVFLNSYPDPNSMGFFKEAGVLVEQHVPKEQKQ
ncbi:cytidine/deoxycytidylate deaminase family protein [Methanolapillus millepedarum]|uniref:tRNA-specific adenosine deaminase n=1 Tax=Methanolapillus millepedarum TaxID=3028296 RepID=A0AA96ZVX3_9EURY|nr:tRNA-specific adenosine deaminase [Methanosarcinaceae archaeon Ac7]